MFMVIKGIVKNQELMKRKMDEVYVIGNNITQKRI